MCDWTTEGHIGWKHLLNALNVKEKCWKTIYCRSLLCQVRLLQSSTLNTLFDYTFLMKCICFSLILGLISGLIILLVYHCLGAVFSRLCPLPLSLHHVMLHHKPSSTLSGNNGPGLTRPAWKHLYICLILCINV